MRRYILIIKGGVKDYTLFKNELERMLRVSDMEIDYSLAYDLQKREFDAIFEITEKEEKLLGTIIRHTVGRLNLYVLHNDFKQRF